MENVSNNNSAGQPFPIVLQYNSLDTRLAKTYRKTLNKNNFFENFKIINAYKNHANLGKMLVRSELKPPHLNNTNSIARDEGNKNGNKFFQCNDPNCATCKSHAHSTAEFTSSTFRSSHKVTGNITCKTKNIIYLITCTKCNIQYVGETGRCLSERLTDHRSNIKNKKNDSNSHPFQYARTFSFEGF